MNFISKEKRVNSNYCKSKTYQQYGKYCLTIFCPGERHAQSDRNRLRRHLASKSVRRGLERELIQIIKESVEN